MFKSITLRFLRGFIAGGVANLAAILAANQFAVSSIAELQVFAYTLGIAFVGGGILALDKLIREWLFADEDPSPETSNQES